MLISDLTPATSYLFRVQALGGDGSTGGSSMEEQFETLPEGTEENHWRGFCSFGQRMRFHWSPSAFLGHLTQNNTAVIFGAAVGGAVMLFIVVVVLFLRRRSVNAPSCCPPCRSLLLISENTASFTGFLSHSSALPLWGPQMPFTFNLSSPLSFSLPLANFLFLFSGSVSYCSLGKNLRWMCLVILNGYILVSVEAFQRKLVQSGTLLVIRGAWFFL